MQFLLCNCPGYVPPDSVHELAAANPLSGLLWKQGGTDLAGRTLRSQCTAFSRGNRCPNATTFDYRYCHKHLRTLFSLMIAPTTVPNLKGWGLFVVDPGEFVRLGLDTGRRPVANPKKIVFKESELVGGDDCYFVGEYVSSKECDHRYAGKVCGDYVIGEGKRLIDGQVARTVLQFSNDAINLADPLLRRNLPTHRCMPGWPIVQNTDGVEYDRRIHLMALCDLRHGDEIFWSYSGENEGSEEDYWSAVNHQKNSRGF